MTLMICSDPLVFWQAFRGATLETCPSPPFSVFRWLFSLQGNRRSFAATLAPGTGPLITPISKQSFFQRGAAQRLWCCDCTNRKKHLREKNYKIPPLLPQTAHSLCCRAFLFIIIIIPKERTYDIISVIQQATASIYILLFMQPPCALGAMHWSITKLAWKDIPPFKSSRGHFT